MEKIKSFTINHDTLTEGIYLSRVDGDINTYDLRLVKPNHNKFLSTGSMHTIEHLFATYARNSVWKDDIISVRPMGCRTGFYLLTRNTICGSDVIKLIQQSFGFIADFEGEIPGSKQEECGNYLDHDLNQAKIDILPFLKKIENYSEIELNYPD